MLNRSKNSKLKKSLDTLKLISLGMEKLENRWYFGLHTALNGATHEYIPVIYVMSNKIYRPRAIKISGENVRFIKLVNKLFSFGVIENNGIKFSDLEKTLLDMIYISKYRSLPEERILSIIEEYGKKIRKRKIAEYLKFYPKSVARVIEKTS